MRNVNSLPYRILVSVILLLIVPLGLLVTGLYFELFYSWRSERVTDFADLASQRLVMAQGWSSEHHLVITSLISQLGMTSLPVIQQMYPYLTRTTLKPTADSQRWQLPSGKIVEPGVDWLYLDGDQIILPIEDVAEPLAFAMPAQQLIGKLRTVGGERPLALENNLDELQKHQIGGFELFYGRIDGAGPFWSAGNHLEHTNFYVLTLSEQSPWSTRGLEPLLLRLSLLVLLAFSIGLAAIIGLTWRLGKPLRQLGETMIAVGAGNWQARFEADVWAFDLNRLGATFNNMVEQLQCAQKQATAEAVAHASLATELALGGKMQRTLLPKRSTRITGIQTGSLYRSSRDLGGDFYDTFAVPGADDEHKQLLFFIADVSGKGLEASLYSVQLRSLLRACSRNGAPLHKIVEDVNQILSWDTEQSGQFITAWIGRLEASSGELEYVCAGHPMALLKRSDGSVQSLVHPGTALGVDRRLKYTSKTVQVGVHETLLLYTDGLWEQPAALSGQMYGMERVEKLVAMLPVATDPEATVSAVEADFKEHLGSAELHDDLTLFALWRTNPS